MNGYQTKCQEFFRFVQMTDVSTAVVLASIALAAFFQWSPIFFIFLVFHIHATRMNHGHAISCYTGREYAVKHINPTSHSFDQAIGSTDPHEVAGFIHRQPLGGVFQNVIHQVVRFSHRKTADCHTIKRHRRNFQSTPLAQILVHTALHDTKHAPVRSGMGLDTTFCPTGSTSRGMVCVGIIRRIGNTFIKSHSNIAAQIFLGMDRHFWG